MKTGRRWVIGVGLTSSALGLLGGPSCASKYEETTPDASPVLDATPTVSAETSVTLPAEAGPDADLDDAGVDATTCDVAKVDTDPKNCGVCGHDCLYGTCTLGKCDGVVIGSAGVAPFRYMVEHGAFVYASTSRAFAIEEGGIWRASKTPGSPAVRYVDMASAETMRVVGDTLYFVVDEGTANDAGKSGGFWSCDLNGPVPCTPKLISPAEMPGDLRVVDGVLYYLEQTRIARYEPGVGSVPTTWHAGVGPGPFFLAGESYFYLGFNYLPSARVSVWVTPRGSDAGSETLLSQYTSTEPKFGDLLGTTDALYFTTFDSKSTSGGLVRRVPRPGSSATPCDYGGAKNLRPEGLLLDDKRIYWTNLGALADTDVASSIAYCELAGCCVTPTVVWTSASRASTITSDTTSLYWTTTEGTIWRGAKP